MKIGLLNSLLFSGLFCGTVLAESYKLDGAAYQPPSTSTEIVYGIPVTSPPANLWVYKVESQIFNKNFISQLLTVSGLDWSNRIQPSSGMLAADAGYMLFETTNRLGQYIKRLDIEPEHGWIAFHDNSSTELKPAPTEKEAIQFAYEFISSIGITNYSQHPQSMSIEKESFETSSNMVVTGRGIAISRAIDGINEMGFCFNGNFKNGGTLKSYAINWRNLVRDKLVPIATTNDIIQFIRDGAGRVFVHDEDAGILPMATKLTITRFKPIYFSAIGTHKISSEYPYVELDIVADCGTNRVTFYMNCPLIK